MGRTWRRVALQGRLDLRYSMAVGVVHESWVKDERCAELSKGCPTSKSSVLSYEVASNVSTDTCKSSVLSYEAASNVSTDTGDK